MSAAGRPGPFGSHLLPVRKASGTGPKRAILEIRAEGVDRPACAEELRKLRRIRSPHVPVIHEAFDCPERSSVCLLIDDLGSKTLRDVMAGPGSMSLDRIVPILVALFDALGGAHGATDEARRPTPIVHGELRPEHVAMVTSGRALILKVLGFGIEQVIPQVPRPLVGYSAPEVLRGERPLPASDVYSAGILAWELLAGRHPFAGADRRLPAEDALSAKMQATEVPPLPAEVAAAVPPSLQDLLVELCSLDPALRPTATSVRVRLTHALNPLAWARARIARVRRPQTRRGWIGALLVIALLLGGGALAAGTLRTGRFELPWGLGRDPAPAPITPRPARAPTKKQAPARSRDAQAPAPTGEPTVQLVGGVTRLIGNGDRRAIAAALRRRLPALQTCYERRLEEAPAIEGEMSVQFTVQPSGALQGVDIGRNTTEDRALAFCVQGQIGGVRVYPAPGTEAEAWATFSFGRTSP